MSNVFQAITDMITEGRIFNYKPENPQDVNLCVRNADAPLLRALGVSVTNVTGRPAMLNIRDLTVVVGGDARFQKATENLTIVTETISDKLSDDQDAARNFLTQPRKNKGDPER